MAASLLLHCCCTPCANSVQSSTQAVLVPRPCVSRLGSSPTQQKLRLAAKGSFFWRRGAINPLSLSTQAAFKAKVSSILPLPTASVAALVHAIKGVVLPAINITSRVLVSRIQECPPWLQQSVPAFSLMAFAVWGLPPSMRLVWRAILKKDDSDWENSQTHRVLTTYMQPLILWAGIIMICRAMDPVEMQSEASHAIKQRSINFMRSLSTVLVFTFCTGSLTQQVQKYMMKRSTLKDDPRNMSVQFIGNAVYTSVWVAAVCLFLELLGFSTHKWLAAGGFGTVLLTLAGREIFTNFLSSMMIHATKPFVESEWIQTKIEGQEVSGTVEYVGWWSPTIIRGDEREAVHIPNHKFSVSVVRNLTQKTHWRIKTHIGVSHLDVDKINDIVADMRKVLANHPQVEQQRLHRRVFFDLISPKNLALMILVSCFVKTSRFEEYLRVKEAILLDLLKVVAHHNARLATHIRSIQRVTDESEARTASGSGNNGLTDKVLLGSASGEVSSKDS